MLEAFRGILQPFEKPVDLSEGSLNNLELPSFQVESDDAEYAQVSESERQEDDLDSVPSFPAATSAQRSVPARLSADTTSGIKPKRRKVILEPGYSAFGWANLKASGRDLRACVSNDLHRFVPNASFSQGGVAQLRKIPYSELKEHKTREDAWSAYNGRVYNISPYLKFHPGGVGELMRSAGKDGTTSLLPF